MYFSDIDYCKSDPCQNGGTCSNRDASFRCDCVEGFSGYDCGISM